MILLELNLPLQEAETKRRAQIHDELLFLVREEHLPRAARLVRDAMESVGMVPGWWRISVPLRVKLETGPSWGELKEYECP
jgi:DNA polymerase I-like protein with 3'-5' exonuclease and polymerase domains